MRLPIRVGVFFYGSEAPREAVVEVIGRFSANSSPTAVSPGIAYGASDLKGGSSMAKVGKPPRYKTVKEMQDMIDKYFEECEGKILKDNNGEPYLDKYGNPIIYDRKPLTITGLALALGFNSRQSLLNYQGKEEFMDTITRAKSIVEQYAETRLYDKDGANGAKFSLANNFEGWREKQQIEADVKSDVTINIELVEEE